jgi:ribosomal protein S12 methylthiotransferase
MAPRIIKKYPNRRLYDTETSTYITLAEVKDLVLQYKVFQVQDAKTGDDLTRAILLQIILEEESGGVPMFTTDMLANIIRYYGHAMQGLMGSYLERSIHAFHEAQKRFQAQAETPLRRAAEDARRRRVGTADSQRDGRLSREGRQGGDRHAGRASHPGAQALLGFSVFRRWGSGTRGGEAEAQAQVRDAQGPREEVKAQAPRVGFVSLGCPKALVDSEQILTRLRAEGYDIAPTYEGSDLVVVNTCGFIDAAVKESLDAIGEALSENGKVIVTGCLGAKGDVVREAHPRVLAVTGPHAAAEVMDHVHAHLPRPHDPFTDLVPPQGIKLTPKHYAYLKISEGCNHRCTFCIIPSMRGDLVSRPVGDVMKEAEALVKAGVKELLVVSQDTSAYGVDVKYRTGFWGGRPLRTRMTELCSALGELGVWVRLHYVYPYPHVDEVIPLMAEGRILPYLDIPFQHASARILKLMKRPAATEKNLERIRAWRAACPDITIRSTFIAGFPGETEAEFEDLLEFLREAQLDRVGCFAYSPVEGAAANALPDAVPESVREERRARFMEVQAAISREKLARKVGREMEVIVDEAKGRKAIARSAADAPEIDGVVRVRGTPQGTRAGDKIRVHITQSDDHDLIATCATESVRA